MTAAIPMYSNHRITYSLGVHLSGHWTVRVDWGGCLRSILTTLDELVQISLRAAPLWVPMVVVLLRG
ncbi:hypothetical protein [Agromyces ramosus]|uniref:Uncharacterized protein n=1 Tax=Agromyces ramosus TaxID=33879 RepID=A0ABU0R9N4_9MICO|nr:hypothetical protein [Agromyces ramosus]MDQ0894442.1 hypothetical protein [Agromyces ramosus]